MEWKIRPVGELVLMLQAMTIALPSWIFHVGTLNLPPAFIHIFDFVLASNVNHGVGWMLIVDVTARQFDSLAKI